MVALGLLACGFDGSPASMVDATIYDVAADSASDTPDARVRDGLVGLWTFDEAAGSLVAADTSNAGSPVPFRVVTGGGVAAPSFANGTVTSTSRSRMISMPERSRLAADIVAGGGVTLEIWLRPSAAVQGDAAAPRFVVGLAKTTTNRDIAILQRGDKWLALVRTNTATSGTPELVSNSAVRTDSFTHIVVVADSTQRQIFVDDRVELVDPVPGPLSTWETDPLLVLFEEPTGSRFWTGSVSLVALYRRALSLDEVHTNFVQGPEAQ